MSPDQPRYRLHRQITAALRDTWLLIRQFGWPLTWFALAITGGGGLYYILSQASAEPANNLAEAIYLVLSLTFFQSSGAFPRTWYLEVFYFLMPVIGVIILAQGVTEFGVMLFNRRQRGKEWEMAVASTFKNHHILVGLGHLGFRVAMYLIQVGQEVVVVEKEPSVDLVEKVKRLGIPVIEDDATREAILEGAGVERAYSIILCTQNDSINLQIALKARSMNQNIRVVVRIFDDDFAYTLQEQFGFTAFSATDMAAPSFAAAASGVEMTRPIGIEGEILSLARIKISNDSRLSTLSVNELEQNYHVSVVLLKRDSTKDLHPVPETILLSGDTVAVIGEPTCITNLVFVNNNQDNL